MLSRVSPESSLFPSVPEKFSPARGAASVEDVLARLESVRASGSGWSARCPHHPDQTPSLVVRQSKLGRPYLKCFAGCKEEDIWNALGLAPSIAPTAAGSVRTTAEIRSWNTTQDVYEYQDANRNPVFLVVRRLEPDGSKSFRQYRSLGPGLWKSGVKGLHLVPFRLPELLDAVHAGQTVFIVEGEKDVHTLTRHGLVATCNAGGAGKWRDSYSAFLRGAHVVILPDNDDPGREHAHQVARSLVAYTKTIRIVELPDLPNKGDVSDWIASGGTPARLTELVEATPPWEFTIAASPNTSTKKPVITFSGKLSVMADHAMEALLESNDPPYLFQRGSTMVRLETEEERLQLVPLSPDALRGELDRTAEWIKLKETRDGELHEVPIHPPLDVVRDILALPADKRPFPAVDALLRTPVFLESGELLTQPGYHAPSRVYYSPPTSFTLPTVPASPSPEDVAQARHWLLEELLADFPFVGEPSRAHALAALLEHPARRLIGGITPLHLLDAPSPGTGKTLLAKTICRVATFTHPTQLNPPSNGSDEWDKRLTSVLMPGPAVVLMDNINEKGIDSPALAAVLTTEYYSGRILGQSREVQLRNASSWMATGNNVVLSGEVARRTVLCQLDSQQINPEERGGFRHDPLNAWLDQHHPQLYWSLCVMIRAWISAGKPQWKPGPGTTMMGSYEKWCRVIGGILDVAGVPGFLGNRAETRQKAGFKDDQWREFFSIWKERYGSRPVSVKELLPLVEGRQLLLGIVKGKDLRAIATSLGMAVRAQTGRIFTIADPIQPDRLVPHRLLHTGTDSHSRSPLYCFQPL